MLQHLKIADDLFLVKHTHRNEVAVKAKKDPINHFWLFDRSGSMHYELRGVINDLKKLVRTLSFGDTISLGYFSSEKEYRFILTGYPIDSSSDFDKIDKILDDNSHSLGATCFSEILAETKQVIGNITNHGLNFSLCFLTDGYPCVSNYAKEIEKIFLAVESLKGVITTALLIGYGNYYNKALMADIAGKLGASLVHSGDLGEFEAAFDNFLGDSKHVTKKVPVKIDLPYARGESKYPFAFSVSGSVINILAQEAGNEVLLTESENAEDYVYILSSVEPPQSKEVHLKEQNVRSKGVYEPLVRGIYAAAYVLCQNAKTDQAIRVLGSIGDKHLTDVLTNAFTPSEYGFAEKELVLAINDEKYRYVKGYDADYLPASDAFCLLDALDILGDDEDAFFYPRHPDWKYSRIGAKTVNQDKNAPEFKADVNARVPISKLVWSEEKLNLSIPAKIDGTIKLTGEFKELGFQEDFPTHINRTYTIVKDGFLNVKTLPVSLSQPTFKKFKNEGLISSREKFSKDQVYLLRLDSIPIINRDLAEGRTSAAEIAKLVKKEVELKGKLKALRWIKSNILEEIGETPKEGVFASFRDDQVAFLEGHFIGKNGFSPKEEKAEATDHYLAKEFQIKVKGLSSLPAVDKVVEKVGSEKRLTISEQLVQGGLNLWDESEIENEDREVQLAWVNSKIAKLQKEKRQTAREIQEAKFAVLLAKKWFDEFKSRDENEIDVDGLHFTFAVSEVKVAY